jgi:hypothetical protein
MKIFSRLSLMILVSLLFGACATTGPKFTELSPQISEVSSDVGRIYLYRKSVLGAAIQPEVKLNGDVIGKAVPNGFFYVDKSPGNYEIMTSTEVDRKLSITLEGGQTRYVRLNISMGFFVGHVYPELVDLDVGTREIQDCRYIGNEK